MKLTICMLIAQFPPLIGGTETQAQRLSESLKTKGIDVFVLTQHFKGLKRREIIDKVPIYRLSTFGRGKFRSFIFMLSTFLFLVRKRRQYQIVHTHLASSPAIVAVIAGEMLRKKVIVKFAGAGKTGDIGTAKGTFSGKYKLKFLRKYTDFFVCPSEEVKKELIEYKFPEKRMEKIPNGVDIKKFSPVNKNIKEKLKGFLNLPGNKIATFAGRLELGKGLEILLSAWQKIISLYPDAHLSILGKGSLKSILQNKARELHIDKQVTFKGEVENVDEYFKASDIFILPSFAEGLSNALLEAMACGLPIVATNIGGTKEVIENDVNGILVEPKNPEELAQAISSLIRDEKRAQRLGRNAQKTVKESYSLDRISKKYIQLYSQLLKEKP